MKRIHKIIVALVSGLLIIFIGSSCVQDIVTPAYVDKNAAEWANVPTKMLMPYTTLWDAKRVLAAIDFRFATEKIKAGYYGSVMSVSIAAGEEFKNFAFSPTGPVGLLTTTVGGGALGAFLIKRPGDKSKKELENEAGSQP